MLNTLTRHTARLATGHVIPRNVPDASHITTPRNLYDVSYTTTPHSSCGVTDSRDPVTNMTNTKRSTNTPPHQIFGINSKSNLRDVRKRLFGVHKSRVTCDVIGSRRPYSTLNIATFPGRRVTSSRTSLFAELVAHSDVSDLSDDVIARSKRMILDTLGVGIIGAQSEASSVVRDWVIPSGDREHQVHQNLLEDVRSPSDSCAVWGTSGVTTTPTQAAFLNGVSVHSMDYDDTWHPATHPSGSVLATLLALAESRHSTDDRTLQDLLVSFNVGVEVQGRLLRCSTLANNIPTKFHPPAVVGVMGSAAAASHFLRLDPHKCRHALAIATSFAGAPMANAGTKTKPLHCGKSARSGLEAALLAQVGIEGNEDILDLTSGFGVFYDDYDTTTCGACETGFVLGEQDVAIKRYPTHLGTHWGIDASLEARDQLAGNNDVIEPENIDRIVVSVPGSKYINRPFPASEYEARHSFQFNVCTALLDGQVTPLSYQEPLLRRTSLTNLLNKTVMRSTPDNVPSFNSMYVEVTVIHTDGRLAHARCDTPYGHWRRPLSYSDLCAKFFNNTSTLPSNTQKQLVSLVDTLDTPTVPLTELTRLLHR